MADSRITDLTEISGATLVAGDLFPVVDVSDKSTTPAGAGGSNKKITRDELMFGLLRGREAGGNADGSVAATSRYYAMPTTLTADRTITLPAVAGVPAGVDITVADEGAIGTTGKTISIVGSGTETIEIGRAHV